MYYWIELADKNETFNVKKDRQKKVLIYPRFSIQIKQQNLLPARATINVHAAFQLWKIAYMYMYRKMKIAASEKLFLAHALQILMSNIFSNMWKLYWKCTLLIEIGILCQRQELMYCFLYQPMSENFICGQFWEIFCKTYLESLAPNGAHKLWNYNKCSSKSIPSILLTLIDYYIWHPLFEV